MLHFIKKIIFISTHSYIFSWAPFIWCFQRKKKIPMNFRNKRVLGVQHEACYTYMIGKQNTACIVYHSTRRLLPLERCVDGPAILLTLAYSFISSFRSFSFIQFHNFSSCLLTGPRLKSLTSLCDTFLSRVLFLFFFKLFFRSHFDVVYKQLFQAIADLKAIPHKRLWILAFQTPQTCSTTLYYINKCMAQI